MSSLAVRPDRKALCVLMVWGSHMCERDKYMHAAAATSSQTVYVYANNAVIEQCGIKKLSFLRNSIVILCRLSQIAAY